jgi:hypothetical protein
MKGYWNQLRPLEKRLLVGVSAVVFIILNAWFVVPYFSDWGRVQKKRVTAETTLALFQTQIATVPTLQKLIAGIEGEDAQVPQEDQAAHFATAIQMQAAQHGVGIVQTFRIQTFTNQNFVELSEGISVQSKEQPLVDFLYNLGRSGSLIRVRDITLRTDQPRQNLAANITLIASYQRRMPTRSSSPAAAPPARTSAPAAKSSGAPVTKQSNPTTQPAVSTQKNPPPNAIIPGLPGRPGVTNKPSNPKK